jgi:hypothetical protein
MPCGKRRGRLADHVTLPVANVAGAAGAAPRECVLRARGFSATAARTHVMLLRERLVDPNFSHLCAAWSVVECGLLVVRDA